MADGGLRIELDEALGARLKDAADAAGESADAYAAGLIARALDDRWAESYARFAEYERTREFVDATVAMRRFRETVAERLKARQR